jgi:hypothetical protein
MWIPDFTLSRLTFIGDGQKKTAAGAKTRTTRHENKE